MCETKEEWKDIPGYEGLYQVSDRGQVRSLDRCTRHRHGGERFIKGRILKHYMARYMQVILCENNKIKAHYVHRLVLTAFDRPPKDNEECNHRDGNKENNSIWNLEWVTQDENNWHKCNVLGKHSRGEKNPNVKLTERGVKGIKELLKEGKLTQKEIANRYKVSRLTVNHIKLNKIWRHVK